MAADISDGVVEVGFERDSDLEFKLNRYYYTQDEQGSTIYITDKHQNIRNEYCYDAFGNVLDSKEEVHNRITYTGQQFDNITQQYYLRARFYNPVVGRFTQEDVYRGDGLNLYAYCGNNPVIYYDPSGYEICPEGNSKENNFDNKPSEKPKTAKELRNTPGSVSGGDNFKNIDKTLRGTEGNIGKIPKEIADNLRGMEFDNFDDFRKTFWKEMGNYKYADEFAIDGNLTNIYRMRNGGSPFASKSQTCDGRIYYEVHHKTPINQGGGVYDLDNLVIVTPRYHAEMLDPNYHGYNGFKKYFK